MKNVLTPLAKRVLIPLRLTASATDGAIQKNIWIRYNSIINSKQRNERYNIMNIVKSLEKSGLIIKEISEIIKRKRKKIAASATDGAIQKDIWIRYNSIINSKQRNERYNIMNIVKSLEKSGLIIKEISEIIKRKRNKNNKKMDFSEFY